LGGPQSCFRRGGEEKNSQASPEIEPQNLDRPAHSLKLIIIHFSKCLVLMLGMYRSSAALPTNAFVVWYLNTDTTSYL